MPKKKDWENSQQLKYVLLHEYTHICRFDMVTKLIAALALCIHWFNPFVWAMYILFNRDIELSCDESVVRHFGENTKSFYARTLITMEEKKSGLTPLYNSFSRNAIEENWSNHENQKDYDLDSCCQRSYNHGYRYTICHFCQGFGG